jgi:hypothetical protein
VGRLTSFDGHNVEILTPTLYGNWKKYIAKVSEKLRNKLNIQSINSLNYFLIFESLNGNVQDVVESVETASPIDLLGHLISFTLYLLRLGNKRLFTLYVTKYESIFRRCFKVVDSFCRRENTNYSALWDPYNVFEAYLSQYFRIIDNSIYYIPNNQFQLSDEKLRIYDKGLQSQLDSLSDIVKSTKIREKFTTSDHNIYDFIKLINDLKQLLIWNDQRDFLYNRL